MLGDSRSRYAADFRMYGSSVNTLAGVPYYSSLLVTMCSVNAAGRGLDGDVFGVWGSRCREALDVSGRCATRTTFLALARSSKEFHRNVRNFVKTGTC